MNEINKKVYAIEFYLDTPNWVSLSSVDKETFYGFVDYLYSLDREIVVLPYICGGFTPPFRPVEDKDLTRNVIAIAKDIKNNAPIHDMLSSHFSVLNNIKGKYYEVHFIEDIFEALLSLGVNKEESIDIVRMYRDDIFDKNIGRIRYQLLSIKNINTSEVQDFVNWLDYKPHIRISRWEFIYMFRNEFKKYMSDKGYVVNPVGGWVLNNKEREFKLGLIDEKGELL